MKRAGAIRSLAVILLVVSAFFSSHSHSKVLNWFHVEKAKGRCSIVIESAEPMKCYRNSHQVLEVMKRDPDQYDLNRVKVLYINHIGKSTDRDKWIMHAVVEYDGLIFDAHDFLETKVIEGVPVLDYMSERQISARTFVREIPAREYLQNYREGSFFNSKYYSGGMLEGVFSPDFQRFPTTSFKGYLKRYQK